MTEKAGADAALRHAVSILEARKAEGLSNLWDYFVVCSGLSAIHVKTLYDYLREEMEKYGHEAAHRDTGFDNKWIIVDYGDILVHIFDRESREYYSIEKMWGEREDKGNAAKFLKTMKKKIKAKKQKRKAKNAKKKKKR